MFRTFPHNSIREGMTLGKKPDDPFWYFRKIPSCSLCRPVFDFFYHQYGICHMYSKENPQDFRLPVPRLYPGERVMLLLGAEASFKPGGPFPWEFTSEHLSHGFIPCRPSLAYKGCGYSIFCTELPVGIIGIYWIGSHTSYPKFMSFCCIRIQSLSLMPSLNALNARCSMNDMPSICMLFAFAPNSTDFISFPLTIGRI